MCSVLVLQERGWETPVYNHQGMHSYPTLDLAQHVAVHLCYAQTRSHELWYRFALASGSHA